MYTKILLICVCSLFMSLSASAKTFTVGVALANFDLNFISILRTQMQEELKNNNLNGQFVDAKGDISLQVQQVDDFINQGSTQLF